MRDSQVIPHLVVRAGGGYPFLRNNQFWGARYGQLKDPFGHVWSIGGPLN